MKYLISFLLLIVLSINVKAQVDPNFYIFLCFGQSNMEGAAVPEAIDEEYVDERFQTLACENFYTLGRTMGEWYTAYPPIVRENTNIGMADYFGRTMVAALPAECRVGVVDVAVGGVGITAFMPENAADWAWIMNNTYNNDPYTRLVQMAKIAQESGVIKGILLHQGERDCGEYDWQNYWPEYVKTVYENLLTDLGLSASEVPLLVGEVVAASEKGVFSAHNPVIATVPSVIPTAHVISAEGCPSQSDHMHFALPGYRLMGKRYALKMLSLMGYPTCMDAFYQLPDNLYPFYKATSISSFEDISLEPGEFMSIDVTASFADEHVENVTANVDISCTGDGVQIVGNQLTCVSEASTLVTISYTDFIGETVSTSFYVNKSDEPEEIVVIGDVNGDEVLDDNDLKAVVDYIMGRTPEGLFDPDKANLNHDEDVNAADVVLLINLMGQQNAVNE
jgi:hypothetical protein